MPGTFRACSNACLSASPESIVGRKARGVEGLGPPQGGLGTGSILMKILVFLQCKSMPSVNASSVSLHWGAQGSLHRVSIANESDQVT